MKYLIIIFLLASCSVSPISDKTKQDSVKVVPIPIINPCTKLITERDSFKTLYDSSKSKLFLANYKIQKVNFYISICNRNKTQEKFLKGWVSRAIK